MLPLWETSNTLTSFFFWGAQSNKGKHQDLHAEDRSAAHRYHFFTWQLLANHCSGRELLMVQKGCSKGPPSPSLFKSVGKAARNRCPAAAAEITQVKPVAGNKGPPQNSFISSFLGTWLPWQRELRVWETQLTAQQTFASGKAEWIPVAPKSM